MLKLLQRRLHDQWDGPGSLWSGRLVILRLSDIWKCCWIRALISISAPRRFLMKCCLRARRSQISTFSVSVLFSANRGIFFFQNLLMMWWTEDDEIFRVFAVLPSVASCWNHFTVWFLRLVISVRLDSFHTWWLILVCYKLFFFISFYYRLLLHLNFFAHFSTFLRAVGSKCLTFIILYVI